MELKYLRGKTGYIETPMAQLPFYRMSEQEILLFDSGRESHPELFELLEREQLRVRAVVCTHLHIDHISNNEELMARYGTEIYATPGEIAGFHAQETISYSVTAIEDAEILCIDGVPLRLLPTPGHSAGHLCIVTPDDVCCVGDAIVTREVLERAKVPYMEDVDGSIVSMERLRQTDYPLYIAAHKGMVSREELSELIDQNIQKELDLYDLLRQQITGPMDMEEILTNFIRAAGVLSQKMVEDRHVRYTAKVRVLALVNAGEFHQEGNMILPNHF